MSTATATSKRTPEQIQQDRAAIVAALAAHPFGTRPQAGWRQADLDALVKAGVVAKDVRREYDSQTGYAANLFGGAGVMVRQRAYYTLVQA